MHLQELAALARRRGWLTDPARDQVVEVLNKGRTMAAHPGAYVRGIRQVPELYLRVPEGDEACHRIVVDACEQLSQPPSGRPMPGRPARSDHHLPTGGVHPAGRLPPNTPPKFRPQWQGSLGER